MRPKPKPFKIPLPPIKSLADLRRKTDGEDPKDFDRPNGSYVRHVRLVVESALNLGWQPPDEGDFFESAFRWLETNALETDEGSLVAEVNFCRDLV